MAAVELGLMVWLLPPRKIEGRLPLEVEQTEQAKQPPVICPFFGPCWRDGEPVDAAGVPLPNHKL